MSNYITGSYQATWNGLALGRTEEGFSIEQTHKGEIVTFDESGDSPVDMIHRGHEVYVDVTLKEWNAAALATMLWPYNATPGVQGTAIACVGQFANVGAFALPLILTATCGLASTIGTGAGPATWTFHKAIIAPDFATKINLNNKLRVIPIRFITFLAIPVSTTPTRFYTTA